MSGALAFKAPGGAEVLAFGECMVEFRADAQPAAPDTFIRTFGGDTFNTLAGLARLGHSCGYISKLGADAFGDYLRAQWARCRVDATLVGGSEAPTGVYFISVGGNGEREFTYYRHGSAASRFTSSDLPLPEIARASLFYTSGITQAISGSCRDAVRLAMRCARDHGVVTAFDTNYRSRLVSPQAACEALADLRGLIDVAFPSGPEEAETLFGTSEPGEVCARFIEMGARVVAYKVGSAGCWVATAASPSPVHVPAVPKAAVDTSGAGDVFNAGFLHGLLSNFDVAEAGEFGNRLAGLKIMRPGTASALPNDTELRQLMRVARVD
ncbi:sugar kinase [bacterium]|nr:MAG: sugar kinase [bacterium]